MKSLKFLIHYNPWFIVIACVWLTLAGGCRYYYGDDQYDNISPSIGFIGNIVLSANTNNNAIPIFISDNRTRTSSLRVTVFSSNQAVIADQNISISGDNRTLFISPRANRVGSTTITLTVTDRAGNRSATSFSVSIIGSRINASSFIRDVFNTNTDSDPIQTNTVEIIQDVSDEAAFDDLIDTALDLDNVTQQPEY